MISESNLVVVGADADVKQLSREERKLAEKEARRLEKQQHVAITYGDFPKVFAQAMAKTVFPRIASLGSSIQEVVMSHQALLNVLEKKGVLTVAEVAEEEARLIEAFNKAVEEIKAKQEAEAQAASDATLAKLPPEQVNQPAQTEQKTDSGIVVVGG